MKLQHYNLQLDLHVHIDQLHFPKSQEYVINLYSINVTKKYLHVYDDREHLVVEVDYILVPNDPTDTVIFYLSNEPRQKYR